MNLSRSIGDRFLFEIEAMDYAGSDDRLLIYLEIINFSTDLLKEIT